ALDWELDAIRERVYALADQLRARLASLPGLRLRDQGTERCGIVTFTVDGIEPAEIERQLAARNINVTLSSRDSTRLDMESRGLTDLVRASVHYYNTEEEIDRFCSALATIA
ncbi:MAG TPA: aminotransferase class V-fold PLP-dependent enzyme, partial [Ktedonobacterales bacterium]|nr:aminotransferase class V-fold PLP-dependent enzyme [Ktedonobacterales bacterium]